VVGFASSTHLVFAGYTSPPIILEVRLGKGVRPTEVDSYDAFEVRDNLRRGSRQGFVL